MIAIKIPKHQHGDWVVQSECTCYVNVRGAYQYRSQKVLFVESPAPDFNPVFEALPDPGTSQEWALHNDGRLTILWTQDGVCHEYSTPVSAEVVQVSLDWLREPVPNQQGE